MYDIHLLTIIQKETLWTLGQLFYNDIIQENTFYLHIAPRMNNKSTGKMSRKAL